VGGQGVTPVEDGSRFATIRSSLRIVAGDRGIATDEYGVANKDALLSSLHEHGALLFRGFDVGDHSSCFKRLVHALAAPLMQENGEHTPIAETSEVYMPVTYDRTKMLLWHNENSFNRDWPLVIAFSCAKPADEGGETILVDSRALLDALPAGISDEFRAKGVRYVRRMGLGVGRTWQQVFRTDDRRRAEALCREQGFDFEWLSEDVLQTSCVRPAVVFHPITGAASWFNQLQHWHPRCLDSATRDELVQALGEEGLPRDCAYGDGTPIDDSVVDCVLGQYKALERKVALRATDTLILDNVATAHGRAPYLGTRRILVAMGRPCGFVGSLDGQSRLV
jgi:hypothetical protein